jgi:hypothetical protein
MWKRRGSRLVLSSLLTALTIAIAGSASAAAAPTVKQVEPNTGPAAGGTSVTLRGTNFNGTTAVRFGSANATTFTVNSGTSITAVSPALTGGSAIVDVTVTTPEGTSPITTNSTPFSESDEFSYAPAITAIGPNKGPTTGGTSVTINGVGLNATFKRGTPPPCWVCTVSFGATEASGIKTGFESVKAVSPAGTGTVDVTVSTCCAGTSPTGSADRFTYSSTTPPTVVTEAASAVAQASATLNATVNPNGGNVSECKVRIRHDGVLRGKRAVRLAAGVGDEPGRGVGGGHGPYPEHHLLLQGLRDECERRELRLKPDAQDADCLPHHSDGETDTTVRKRHSDRRPSHE